MRKLLLITLCTTVLANGCGSNSSSDDAPAGDKKPVEFDLDALALSAPQLPSLRPDGFKNDQGSLEQYIEYVSSDDYKKSVSAQFEFAKKLEKRLLLDVETRSSKLVYTPVPLYERMSNPEKLSGAKDCVSLLKAAAAATPSISKDAVGTGAMVETTEEKELNCTEVAVADQNEADLIWDCTNKQKLRWLEDEKITKNEKYRSRGLVSGSSIETVEAGGFVTDTVLASSSFRVSEGFASASFGDLEKEYFASASSTSSRRNDDGSKLATISGETQALKKAFGGEKFILSDSSSMTMSSDLSAASSSSSLSVVAKELNAQEIEISVKYNSNSGSASPINRDETYIVSRKPGDTVCSVTQK